MKKSDLKRIEEQFQDTQKIWHETKTKESWDCMFLAVFFAIENAMKKRLKSIYRSDIHDLVADATITVMNRFNKSSEYNIKSLASVAHWAVIGALYNAKQQRIDKELSYDYLLEIGANV